MSQVRDYVLAKFSIEEALFFDFVVASFPEYILIQDGEESEEVLVLLAVLAKTFGNAKELIKNLETAHSASELYEKILAGTLAENNAKLLPLLASDLHYELLDKSLDINTQIAELVASQGFLENSYLFIKNRGTRLAVEHAVKAFLMYIGQPYLQYSIDETNTTTTVLFPWLDDYVDVASATTFGSLICYNVLQDTDLYRLFMKIKPAGMTYNLLCLYVNSLINATADRVLAVTNKASTAGAALLTDIIIDPTYNSSGSTWYSASRSYTVSVTNPSKAAPMTFWLADWSIASLLDGNFDEIDPGTFTGFSYTETIVGPGSTVAITRISTDPGFDSDAYVGFYFTSVSDGAKSTVTKIVFHDIPAGGITIIAPSLSAVKEGTTGTGRVLAHVYNPNTFTTTATITAEWSDSLPTVVVTEVTIIAYGIAHDVTFYSPSATDVLNVTITAKLSATGSDSSEVHVHVLNVPRGNPLGIL